jgi:hypothetical protein
MIDISEFASGCERIGGRNKKDGDKLVCEVDNAIGITLMPQMNELQVVDGRSGHGVNITELENIDHIRIIKGINPAFMIGAGASSILFSRERDKIKIITTIEDEPVYPGGGVSSTRTSLEKAGCPIGSLRDPYGGCKPVPEHKDKAARSPLPRPEYTAKQWDTFENDTYVKIDENREMLKATLGTWLNSDTGPGYAFADCSESLPGVELVVGQEMEGVSKGQNPNYDIQIGRSFYDIRRLYEIASELLGEELLERPSDIPKEKYFGERIVFDVFKSPEPNRPVAITVRDTGDVYYLLAPTLED